MVFCGRRASICPAAMSGCRHEDDFFSFINFIEEPPIADAVTPRGGIPSFKSFDIRTEVGFCMQLGINILTQLASNIGVRPRGNLLEVFCKPYGLEDAVISQRTGLSSVRRPVNLASIS